jgi:ABC-2 type transport system ATP-binding protein
VLVSSHVLSEVQQTVDDVVIISRGRLVRQAALAELDDPATRSALVRTPDPAALAAALAGRGLPAPVADEDGRWRVPATAPAAVGAAAFAGGVELHELTAAATDLEATFLQLTAGEEAA